MLADRRSNVIETDLRTDAVPHVATRLAPHASGHSTFLQEPDSIGKPKELHERPLLAAGVLSPFADHCETQPSRGLSSPQHTPPPRYHFQGFVQMPKSDHQGHSVHRLAIDLGLSSEPNETVAIGLNLVGMEQVTDQYDIGPNLTLTQPELFDNGRGNASLVLTRQIVEERSPNLWIAVCRHAVHGL